MAGLKKAKFPKRICAYRNHIQGTMEAWELWSDAEMFDEDVSSLRNSCFYVNESEHVKLEDDMMKIRLKLAELANRGKYDEDYILDAVSYMSKVIDSALGLNPKY